MISCSKNSGGIDFEKTLIEKVLEIMVLQTWVGSPQLLHSGPHSMGTIWVLLIIETGFITVLWVLVAVLS